MYLLNSNALKGFRSIMSDQTLIQEVEGYIKSTLPFYINSVKEEELLNFEEVFNANME